MRLRPEERHSSSLMAGTLQFLRILDWLPAIKRISQLCKQYGIQFIETEESYTSKSSFLAFNRKKPHTVERIANRNAVLSVR